LRLQWGVDVERKEKTRMWREKGLEATVQNLGQFGGASGGPTAFNSRREKIYFLLLLYRAN